MMPFDRLVTAVDEWAAARGRDDVFAQIGDGSYIPAACRWARKLSSREFADHVRRASLVVAHAGMGTVLKALEAGRPMVLLPRDAARREVTTDHQAHAARWLSQKPGIRVVLREDDLGAALDASLANLEVGAPALSATAPAEFIARIRRALLE
ncbi:MAG: hypothetical protein JST65_03515 [Acidobacteria bacterium]|nr:hypothetical protein [Acidobacteriota bacterium]